MNIKAIINTNIITANKIIENGVILIENGIISDFGTSDKLKIPDGIEIIDAEFNFTGPGFIDIHCHGGGGHWFYENPRAAAEAHLKHGTTSVLATMDTLDGIRKVRDEFDLGLEKSIIGIQMEGPYTNPKYGSAARKAKKPNDLEYLSMIKSANGLIKIWTLAPELEGMEDFINEVEKNKIIMSVGHSEASAEQIYSLIPKGLKVACHCMDATGCSISLTRIAGTREVGVDEAVLVNEDIYAEVIPDSLGIHVRPLMLKLIYKAKGADKIIIITDATNYPIGNPSNEYMAFNKTINDNDLCFDEFGGLRGSRLTMNAACRNMVKHTGAGIVEVFRMASYNPSKLLGIEEEYGNIKVGAKANMVIVSGKLEVKKVIFEGELV